MSNKVECLFRNVAKYTKTTRDLFKISYILNPTNLQWTVANKSCKKYILPE